MKLTFRSPAKINYSLRILGKRADGYHDLSTHIQAIDLCDTLHLEESSHDEVGCNDPLVPLDSTNLILKAAQLFRRKSGKKVHLKVYLEKRIPLQAGLGGGSSNAATTLFGLNRLSSTGYADQELQEWSSEVGSDIPFFFSLGSALCTRRGEEVQPTPLFSADPFWIVKPSVGASTTQVFNLFTKENPVQDMFYFNELEPAAIKLVPAIGVIKEKLLQQGFKPVFMTGSGSALVCMGEARPLLAGVSIYRTTPLMRRPDSWY